MRAVAALALTRWSLELAFDKLSGLVADWSAMRATDTVLAVPDLVAAVVVAGVLGAKTGSLVLAPPVTGWMRYDCVARGIGRSLDRRGYVVQVPLPVCRQCPLPAGITFPRCRRRLPWCEPAGLPPQSPAIRHRVFRVLGSSRSRRNGHHAD